MYEYRTVRIPLASGMCGTVYEYMYVHVNVYLHVQVYMYQVGACMYEY